MLENQGSREQRTAVFWLLVNDLSKWVEASSVTVTSDSNQKKRDPNQKP